MSLGPDPLPLALRQCTQSVSLRTCRQLFTDGTLYFTAGTDPDRLRPSACCRANRLRRLEGSQRRDRHPSPSHRHRRTGARGLDRPRLQGRGHRPGAGRRRGAEGRQRASRHGDEPGAGGLPAVPEGDAAQPGGPALARPGPVRALLRPLQPDPVHPALPGRVRPGARRPQGAADLGLQDPGPPGVRAHQGVEITTGPLGQGIANAVGMAMAARRERGLLDPDAAPGESVFDHQIYCLASDGDIEEGVSSRGVLAGRHPAAGQPDVDLRQQPDLHRGRHQHRPDRGRRRPLRGVRLARADHRLDQRRHPVRGERRGARTTRSRRRRRSPTSRASSSCGRSSPGRPRSCRAPASRTARRWAPTRWPRPRRCSASTRTRPSRSPTRSSPTPASCWTAASRPRTSGSRRFDAWAEANPEGKALYDRMVADELPPGWDDALPSWQRRPQGHRDPRGVREGDQRDHAEDARAVGRVGRPGRVQQHHAGGRAQLPARRTGSPSTSPATRTAGCCTSASASTPWARS